MSDVIFILFSATALVSALLAVTRRNPIYATVWMLSCMSSLAGIYVLLESPFLGIIQILLYAGAILVLFVFVIMLLNQSSDEVMNDAPPMVQRVVATCVAVALLVGMTLGTFSDGFGGDFSKVPEGSQVALLDRSERLAGESGVAAAVPAAPEPAVQGPVMRATPAGAPAPDVETVRFGSTRFFGRVIYTQHVFGFELISLLILASIAGVIVVAKRFLDVPEPHATDEGDDSEGLGPPGLGDLGPEDSDDEPGLLDPAGDLSDLADLDLDDEAFDDADLEPASIG